MEALAMTSNTDPIRVLIIDDEKSIRKTLEGVFRDEGYDPKSCSDANSAFELLKSYSPNLILLDIWMPGMDGIEMLKRLKELYPDIPVIMISGHATIATAMKSTKLGAADFIEKPLDLNVLLSSVKRALGAEVGAEDSEASGKLPDPLTVKSVSDFQIGKERYDGKLNTIAFSNNTLRGRDFKQRTLKNSTILYGQGLHSGKKSGLILEPLPPNSGIHFTEVSDTSVVPAHVDFVDSTGFATTVRFGTGQAGTIEHLMSALHAYGISNLLIKCNGEVPVMDGSALEFCSLIEEIGLEEQSEPWYEIVVDKTYRFGTGKDTAQEEITIEPAEDFTIEYILNYPEPVGTQVYKFTLGDVESYKKEIAPARTFGFVKDIGWLQKQGLALGGRFDNFVLFGDEGAINCSLRFSDEPARHKVLDAIGDLYLLGRRIRGKVTAKMTGHSDNVGILKLIREALRQ